jgi:hypothetical protein
MRLRLLVTLSSWAIFLACRPRVGCWGFQGLVVVAGPPLDVHQQLWQREGRATVSRSSSCCYPSPSRFLLKAEDDKEGSSGGGGDGSSSSSSNEGSVDDLFESESDKKRAVGNLVEDDEWMGLSMELGELVRTAVIEDLKKNAREFLGKDSYKVGDISKEIDSRVKEEVARFRGCVRFLFFARREQVESDHRGGRKRVHVKCRLLCLSLSFLSLLQKRRVRARRLCHGDG